MNTNPRSGRLGSIFFHLSLVLLAGLGLAACGGGGGGSPSATSGTKPSVAAKTSVILAGDADCPTGGVLVETGIDENSNGVLDASEVDVSEKVCNGASGLDSLIDMNPEPVGVNCPNGGLRIDVGIDTNGNGSLDTAEITQTGFVCSGSDGSIGWQVATLIEGDNAGEALRPQVSFDTNGDALAVWHQFDGTRYNIWSNRYESGTGWGVAELIEADNAGNALYPQVSMDANGNAVAVWQQSDGTRASIWVNHYVKGIGWGAAQLIETDDTGDALSPQVSVNANGNAVVVWYQFDNTRYNIWSNRYVVGSGWETAQLVEMNNAGSADDPQVSMDTVGNAVAVWKQDDGTNLNIWSNRYELGTGWGTAQLIQAVTSELARSPQISMDVNGNAVVVWRQGVVKSIWSNRYEVGTGWGTAQLIETDDAGSAGVPQVALDATGNAVVVWAQSDGIRYNTWSNRYVVGSGWGTAQLIETDNAGAVQYPRAPDVAVDTNGNALAVWHQSDGMRDNIWSNRYIVGSGWGTAQLIETDNAGAADFPQVSIDANGNALAVWKQSDGTRTNIWSNRWQAP